ncbi:MAG: MATE family efflux transporter [Acidimicrobiia bacterium]
MCALRLRPGPLDREIARLALPALGALAAEPLYVLADTAVVGHLGTPELGGLAVAGTVLTTAFWIFNFLAYGTTAAVARSIGAGRELAAARQAVQSLWLALGLGAALAVLGLLGAPGAVRLMGASDAVRPHALLYLRVSALGAPAVLVALAGVGYLRGRLDTARPLRIALVANVVNLAGEVTLIYGLGMGLGASALTTVVAQTGAAVVFARLILRDARTAGVRLRPDPAALRSLLAVGRDLFVRTGSLQAALALSTAVASRMGTAQVAAHQVAFQLWLFLALLLDALAIAAQPLIGRLLGAGRADEARAVSERLLAWGVLAGVGLGVAVAALRPVLPGIFTDDSRVEALTGDVLWIVALLQPLNAVVFVLDGILIGAHDLRYLARAMLVSLAVFVPLALAVRGLDLSLLALWGALGVFMAVRLATMTARFVGAGWMVVGARD